MIPLKSQDDVIRDLQAMGFELFVHRTSSWKYSLVGDNGTRRDVYAPLRGELIEPALAVTFDKRKAPSSKKVPRAVASNRFLITLLQLVPFES